MIALALALAAQQPAPAPSPFPPRAFPVPGPIISDADGCTMLRRVADAMMPEVPQQIDSVTRLEGMMVMCGLRTVAFNKTVTVPQTAFEADWRQVRQARWNAIICDNDAFGALARRGWRFVEYLSFRGGERIPIDAHC